MGNQAIKTLSCKRKTRFIQQVSLSLSFSLLIAAHPHNTLAQSQAAKIIPAITLLLLEEDGSPWKVSKLKTFDSLYTIADSSSPRNPTIFKNKLYFPATTAAAGNELWSTDGTPAGTSIAQNIGLSTQSSFPWHLTVFKDELCFYLASASLTTGGTLLWCGDVDMAGQFSASMVPGMVPGLTGAFAADQHTLPILTTITDSYLYFQANSAATGHELGRSDGNSYELAAETNSGTASGSPSGFEVLHTSSISQAVFFSATNLTHGRELWWTDGNVVNLVADIANGAAPSNPKSLTEVLTLFAPPFSSQYKLFFSAFTAATGRELWVHDPNAASNQTYRVKDILSGAGSGLIIQSKFKAYQNQVYFVARNLSVGPTKLWVSDGTNVGTTPLAGPTEPRPTRGVEAGGYLYFPAAEGIWRTQGTSASTELIIPLSQLVRTMTSMGNTLFYTVHESSNSLAELWSITTTDATPAHVLTVNQSIGQPVVMNGALYVFSRNSDEYALHKVEPAL